MENTSNRFRARIADADALFKSKQFEQALISYKAIANDDPTSHEAHYKLGFMYYKLKQNHEAVACYQKALDMWENYPEANTALGVIEFSRGNFAEAERHYRNALAENRLHLEAYLHLGTLLIETSRIGEAKFYAESAIAVNPSSAPAHTLLGQVYKKLDRISDCIASLRRALEIDENYPPASLHLAFALAAIWKFAEADESFARAQNADREFFPAWASRLLTSNYSSSDRNEIFKKHIEYGKLIDEICAPKLRSFPDDKFDETKRLRVGIMSADFRRHSVAYFIRGALQHLNRREFQLYAYYNFRTEDDVTWEIKPLFHCWRDTHALDINETLDRIHEDEIDILIDLNGHTAGARAMVLGCRAAPVQATWIGYPNTTGFDFIDYRITDAWADPEGQADAYYTERLWRLPSTFLCYTPPANVPEPSPPPTLTQQHITLGSFNIHNKISDECLSLWLRILTALPKARLLIKSALISKRDSEIKDRLFERIVALADSPPIDRIEILTVIPEQSSHFEAYNQIDIALDTFPYNGTTTTCDALWMGVPVVTLAGDRHVSRVGVSLLNNIGLGELVAETAEAYINLVIDLANDTQRLIDLRASMRSRMQSSRLLDQRAMGNDLGAALREMWMRRCANAPRRTPAVRTDKSVDSIKLNIGGREVRDGWKILDDQQREGVDFPATLHTLSSFGDESCSEIYCSHVLQRVYPGEVLDVLNNLYRMLIPGGKLYIATPDMDMLAGLFVSPSSSEAQRFEIMRIIFGGVDDLRHINRIGLSLDLMTTYLGDVGFSAIEQVESLGLFQDNSELRIVGQLVSLNLIAQK